LNAGQQSKINQGIDKKITAGPPMTKNRENTKSEAGGRENSFPLSSCWQQLARVLDALNFFKQETYKGMAFKQHNTYLRRIFGSNFPHLRIAGQWRKRCCSDRFRGTKDPEMCRCSNVTGGGEWRVL
jgi:hypothetical protein